MLVTHANEHSAELFGRLDTAQEGAFDAPVIPMMATPAAVAAGVTLTAGAFGAGYAVGYAND